MHTTLVICTLNEENTIQDVIKAGRQYVDEIIVIDGHSSDETVKRALKMGALVFQDEGKGKGQAIRLGIRMAKSDIVVFMDADGSHNPKDIPLLVQPILENKADLVIASRGIGGSDELSGSTEKYIRLIGSSIINLIINLRYKVRITDAQNGFRAIKKKVATSLNLKDDGFTIEQEMVMKALKKQYNILDVSSHEFARKYGHSRINLAKVAFSYILSVLLNIL